MWLACWNHWTCSSSQTVFKPFSSHTHTAGLMTWHAVWCLYEFNDGGPPLHSKVSIDFNAVVCETSSTWWFCTASSAGPDPIIKAICSKCPCWRALSVYIGSLASIHSFITAPRGWGKREPKPCCKAAMCALIRWRSFSPRGVAYTVMSCDLTLQGCVMLWCTVAFHPVAQGCCICCLALWLDSRVSCSIGSNMCVSSRSMCNVGLLDRQMSLWALWTKCFTSRDDGA